VRRYSVAEVALRIRGLEADGPVRLHIEHKSGAALIVPSCEKEAIDGGFRLATTGFDGTDYEVFVDERANTVEVVASSPSPILGGEKSAIFIRGDDIEPAVGVRTSGDEPTMPIIVKDK
jgi:hypothetical protein